MLVETMSVQTVAKAKGVSEAGIRFAVNDPQNTSLVGIKSGGRLLILASSVEGYVPRKYPRMERLKPIANAQQRRILAALEELAADMVMEHPDAARLIRACYPTSGIVQDGKAGYSLGIYSQDISLDGLHVSKREGSANIIIMFPSDDQQIIKQKAQMWALKLLDAGWIETEPK